MFLKHLAAITGVFVCNSLWAQVPVMQEPHHKPVVVNGYVRLLDVHINPGDTTLYHIHATPSVIVEISQSKIGLQKKGEMPTPPGEAKAGNVSFSDFEAHPVTHRVFNAGDNVFHVMDIELVKKEPAAKVCIPLSGMGITTAVNEKLVTAYQINLNGNQTLPIEKSSCAYLLVCITGEINATKTISAGGYIFFEPEESFNIINQKSEAASIVLLQLK
jgi:hypothetical protein